MRQQLHGGSIYGQVYQPLYAGEEFGVELKLSAYALDSTTIDLCLSLFPWARFRKTKAGVKVHTLLDLHGNIPVFAIITEARVHDVNLMDELCGEAGAIYIFDRGYLILPGCGGSSSAIRFS